MSEPETARDLINKTSAGKELFRMMIELSDAANKSKDAGMMFTARQFEKAIMDLWAELEKIKIKKEGTP